MIFFLFPPISLVVVSFDSWFITPVTLISCLLLFFFLLAHLRLILAASLSKMRSSSVDHPVTVGWRAGWWAWLNFEEFDWAGGGPPEPVFDPDDVGGPTWAEVIWVGFRPLKCTASLFDNSSENGHGHKFCKLSRKSNKKSELRLLLLFPSILDRAGGPTLSKFPGLSWAQDGLSHVTYFGSIRMKKLMF